MLIDYASSSLMFKVGEFVLKFPNNVKFETFNDPENYYGIIFYKDTFKYEVLNCKLGLRLLINSKEGESRDIPFHMGTSHLLPYFISVSALKNNY